MVEIQIQSQFWNQFWSLIKKIISDFIFFWQKYKFWVPKNAKKRYFWYSENATSCEKSLNLKPFLESVTKTDSKTVFEFEFWPFLRILAVFGPFWYI